MTLLKFDCHVDGIIQTTKGHKDRLKERHKGNNRRKDRNTDMKEITEGKKENRHEDNS